jgi:hypothetical protein
MQEHAQKNPLAEGREFGDVFILVEGETFVNKHYIRIAFKYFCIMQSG